MKRWLFLLLFFPVVVFGQFRMVSSAVTLDSTVNDSTYIIDVDFFSDQTAKGYFASGITADYRVFSQTGQLYDITAASNLTLSSGELTIVEIDNNYVNTESAPVGQILVFDPQGDYITFTPFGNSNMGQVLQQAIGTYNAVVSAEGGSVPEWSGTANYEQFKQVSQDGKIYTNRTGTNTTTPPSGDLVNWELTNKSAILEEIEGRDTISQASHPFSVGDPLWYSGNYILARDTGASVRVDGIVVEVIDANTFVRQRSGKFTLTTHGFTDNIQLYVQSDGSYGATAGENTLPYGFAVNGNTIEIGLKPDAVRATVESRTFEFSRKTLESMTRAKNNKKTWVVSDTVTISGNLDVGDLDIIFEKNGFILGADTITADGASIQANKSKQLWSNTTIITGAWDIEKSFLEWTIGNTRIDSVTNFRALTNAVELGNVELQKKTYKIALAGSQTANNTTYSTTKDVRIKGVHRDSSILVLNTEHTGTTVYGYFSSENGNNIRLENLTLTTSDYQSGNPESVTIYSKYIFAGCVRVSPFSPDFEPDLEYIELKSINVLGPIGFNYYSVGLDSLTSTQKIIDRIDIDDIYTTHCPKLINITGTGWGSFSVKNSIFNNFFSDLFFAATPNIGSRRGLMVFDNNHFENDTIVSAVSPAHVITPMTVKGEQIKITNNTIKNIKGTGFETVYPFYAISNVRGDNEPFLEVNNNNITGVACDCPASVSILPLLMFKGADNIYFRNNNVTLTKQDFVDVGVIDSLSQSLSTIDVDSFWMQVFRHDVDEPTKDAVLHFTDNVINAPIINHSSRIDDIWEFVFKDNHFVIDFFGLSGDTGEGIVFNAQQPRDGITGVKFISSNNTYFIKESEGGYVKIYGNPVMDATAEEFELYEINDKLYSSDSTTFRIEGFTNELSIVKVESNSPVSYNYTPGGVKLHSDNEFINIKMGVISDATYPLLKFSQVQNATIEADLETDSIYLFNHVFNDRLFRLDTLAPFLVTISVDLINDKGNVETVGYKFIHRANSNTAFEDITGAIIQTSLTNSAGDTLYIAPSPSFMPPLKINRLDGSKSDFKINGLSGYSKIKISLTGTPIASYDANLITTSSYTETKENLTVTGTLTSEKYKDLTPIPYNAVDTIVVDTVNIAFALTPDLATTSLRQVVYTTNANVSGNLSVRLLYYDVSVSSYTAVGAGTITTGNNQVTITGLSQAVTSGDFIYTEVTASDQGGPGTTPPNGLNVNLRFQ